MMKQLILALLAAFAVPAFADDTAVQITITDIPVVADGGSLHLYAYADKKTWLKVKKAPHHIAIKPADFAADGSATVSMKLPAGDWAFTAYYDANNDGKLNTKIFGIPKEPNGLSNDPKPRMGAPKFDQSVIKVSTEAVEISFKIRGM